MLVNQYSKAEVAMSAARSPIHDEDVYRYLLEVSSRETKVDSKPVTGSDQMIGTNNGTRDRRISGDNVREYRQRVQRITNERR